MMKEENERKNKRKTMKRIIGTAGNKGSRKDE